MVDAETTDYVDAFLGLWLDEQMLRVEFDAIIAAEYTDPPTRDSVSICCGNRGGKVRPPAGWRPVWRPVMWTGQTAGERRPDRERSPPDVRLGVTQALGDTESDGFQVWAGPGLSGLDRRISERD